VNGIGWSYIANLMTKRLSLDIETVCAVDGCPGKTCEHALHPRTNRISIIGVDSVDGPATFRSLTDLNRYLVEQPPGWTLGGFNLKWDLRTLAYHGLDIPLSYWSDDALLMATTSIDKVPEQYVEWYDERRKELNKALPKGISHRETKGHSLKILAPYFLGVEPFWEDPTNHDNEEYVIKDAVYTRQLMEMFEEKLRKETEYSYPFYSTKLMPWTKLLARMERRGIAIDIPMIRSAQEESSRLADLAKKGIDEVWAPAYEAYRLSEMKEVGMEYSAMCSAALAKAVNPTPEKLEKIGMRYNSLMLKAQDKIPFGLNLDSPAQVKWLLQTYKGLDISDFHGDEGTGTPVLERLVAEGNEDVKLLLDYRGERKLATAFYPSYLEMQDNGIIHCSFSPFIARTGRLSSSDPNLQQVPGAMHKMFVARPGYKLITKDESAIEPRLIAYYSECPVLCGLLASGVDFHSYNTKIFFGLDCDVSEVKKLYPLQREVGKEVGLAIMYGAGAMRLQESALKRGFRWTLAECKAKVAAFKAAYPGVFAFRQAYEADLMRGPVKNLFGRPFRIGIEDMHMRGVNSLVQGSASDLVWNSAYEMQLEFDSRGLDSHVLLLVHDEIVVEASDRFIKEVEEVMERTMTRYVLPTQHGNIQLKIEGKVSDRWEK
jgi:DNA polymerase I-like protein with 3'-5' exonuclease and polymerase domains